MAPRGKTTQLNNMYVADFETCDSDEIYEFNKFHNTYIYNQRVWLAGYKNLETMKSTYFNNLDDFMNDILARHDNVNREYAFHNLKFDGSYIIPWLFKNGYTVSQDKPTAKEFSVLVDKMNNWYNLTIQVTTKRRVTLWDSLKLFPTALEYLPNVYGTPTHKLQEGKEFYEFKRPEDHVPTKEELEYFENDLQVPAETLNKHIELYGLRFKKTQASQAFYEFTGMFPAWKWRFPPLEIKQDEAIRLAYWGGISHVPKIYRELDNYDVKVYDINSSYPDKAANNRLPYGPCLAEYGEGKPPDMSKFWVAEALVEFKLKEHHLPCIPRKSIVEGETLEMEKWVEDSKGIVKMRFCNIDYITIHESYDFKVYRWCWSMHWAWKVHKEIAKFVNHNNDIKVKYGKLAKKETDPEKKTEYNTMRNRAKINNNSFYGKFGEEVIKEGKTPYYELEEVTWEVDRIEEQNERARKYLPVAIAITAWGRKQLVEAANILGEHFIYCDTDSIHFLSYGQTKLDKATKEGKFQVDSQKLGYWDFEGDYLRGRYLRSKCYMEEKHDGTIEATVAGLPADPHTGQGSKKRSCLNWDNFFIGHEVTKEESNKLQTLRTATGNKLLPTSFRINENDSSLF